MEDIGRVERFESAKCLVDEVLGVVVGKILCPNDSVHICLHELLNHYGKQVRPAT